MSADTGRWQDGSSMVGPEDGQFMTVAEKAMRETKACRSALDQAYAKYQAAHDGILRAYWSAMQSIMDEPGATEVTQVVPMFAPGDQVN